jgi:hypothetical protein
MPYRLECKVEVKVGPMNLVFAMKLDLEERLYGCFLESWELVEGEEKLFISDEQPKTVLRNNGDFRL